MFIYTTIYGNVAMAQLETEDSVNGRAVRAICDIAQVHLPEYTDEYYPFRSD